MSTKSRLRLPARKVSRIAVALFIVAAAGTASIVVVRNLQSVTHAAPVVGFNPGYIISDNIFTNNQTMSADQIQSFLNSKVTSCDTNGTGRASEYGSSLTRAQYAASRGWAGPPYTCLRDYIENGQTSAQIIYNTAQQYRINPQVLLVLLQKEQGLVTDTWPVAGQYRSATGYGCPDTAPCDSQYYGLTNQVVWAAKMFNAVMTKSPTWYSPYVVGNNFIRYSPNSSCGGTNVTIQNLATAALYDYTPYQPNASALNAGYGSGDGCGAYGNRNFYLYFNDWFGSPQYGNLVRTVDNASVYLISGTNKYPIADLNVLNSLYPLGGITFVTQSYLDGLTSGQTLGRIIRSSDGTIYFHEAGIKLPFGSCGQVADYGSSCGQSNLLQDYQINALFNGPSMTSVVATTSGKKFYVIGGSKREVYDDTSLSQAGISGSANVFSESALNNLSYAAPIVRDGAFVSDRASGALYVYSSSTLFPVTPGLQAVYSSLVSSRPLDGQGINATVLGAQSGGYIKSQAGVSYIVSARGKIPLNDPSQLSSNYTLFSDAVLNQLPTQPSAMAPYTASLDNSGTIYYIAAGKQRPIAGWGGLLALNPSPVILSLPSYYLGTFQQGPVLYTPGSLVKLPSDGTVYYVDGLSTKVPMSTFGPSTELSGNAVYQVSSESLSQYTTASTVLSGAVQCGSSKGIAIGGRIYEFDIPNVSYVTLSTVNCNLYPRVGAPGFLLGVDGTIYKVNGIERQPIRSYATYLQLGGNQDNTVRASSYPLSFIPLGSTL